MREACYSANVALSRSLLIALLCLVVIASPVGAHLHLCFDGQEPAASLHLIDDGMHHPGGGLDRPHHDAEVNVDTHGLPKLDKYATFAAARVMVWLPFASYAEVGISAQQAFLPATVLRNQDPRTLAVQLKSVEQH